MHYFCIKNISFCSNCQWYYNNKNNLNSLSFKDKIIKKTNLCFQLEMSFQTFTCYRKWPQWKTVFFSRNSCTDYTVEQSRFCLKTNQWRQNTITATGKPTSPIIQYQSLTFYGATIIMLKASAPNAPNPTQIRDKRQAANASRCKKLWWTLFKIIYLQIPSVSVMPIATGTANK